MSAELAKSGIRCKADCWIHILATYVDSKSKGTFYSCVKRGLVYNEPSLMELCNTNGLSWAYNWGDSPNRLLSKTMEYVPMLRDLGQVAGRADVANRQLSQVSVTCLSTNRI